MKLKNLGALFCITLVLGLILTGCATTRLVEETGQYMGLSYKAIGRTKDWLGGDVTVYVLNQTYTQARNILTQRFGQPLGEYGGQGDTRFWDELIETYPDYVMFQETSVDVRLLSAEGGGIGWNVIDGLQYSSAIYEGTTGFYVLNTSYQSALETLTAKYGEPRTEIGWSFVENWTWAPANATIYIVGKGSRFRRDIVLRGGEFPAAIYNR